MKSINPNSGLELKSYKKDDADQIKKKLKNARIAFDKWSAFSFEARAFRMREVASILESNRESYAKLITKEMGKIRRESLSEIDKCVWVCRYYADQAQQFLADEIIQTDASESFVTYQPLGTILAVMPWNFPFWQVFRFAAPTLMAGNVGILKHASNVQGCAYAIEDIFKSAGFPNGSFQNLPISHDQIRQVIKTNTIKAVTLTGSDAAGRAVGSLAGQSIKKTLLELGGSDPYIVLEDANVELAVDVCLKSRMINNGQSCIAAKRFIVVQDVYDDFVDQLKKKIAELVVGNPMSEKTDIGPMARKDLRKNLQRQIERSIAGGAKVEIGGKRIKGDGYFFQPTLLTHVTPGMPVFDEEVFGPVASVIKAKHTKMAIRLANQTDFGLGAAIFTENLDQAREIARDHLRAGACFVNGMVKSDPRLPFGGIGLSGYGRELSEHGIREFVNTKTIWIK